MNPEKSRSHIQHLGFCSLLLFLPAVTKAQSSVTNDQPYRLNPIIVVGNAEAGPAETASATRLSGEWLAERGVTSPRELTAVTPNLTTFDANGDRIPRFSLRGLRENNFSYGESAVGIYVDDVPYSDLYTRGTPLFDIAGGDFYRGPQPTLFGANRPGGVLNLLTRLPGDEWHANSAVSYGNYNAATARVSASGPVAKDELSIGVAGLFQRRDGYFDNLVTGNDPDTHESFAGRGQLRWTPTERLDFTATVVADQFHDGGVITRPLTAPGDLYDVKYDQDGYNDQSGQTYSLRGAWTGDTMELISISTWRRWKQTLAGDFDYAEFSSPGNAPFQAIQGFAGPKVQQGSQEFRLQSLDADAPLRWNVGAYWAQQTIDLAVGRNFFPGAPFINPGFPGSGSDVTTGRNRQDQTALFGQGTYRVTEQLDLTAGARCEYFDINGSRNHSSVFFGPVGATYSDSYGSVQPRVGLTYHFTTNVSAWANFTTGFQPGGYSSSDQPAAISHYSSARSRHYEIGSSFNLLDGKLIATASGFWIDTRNYQVYRPINNGFDNFIANANRARSFGAELELRALPCRYFEFRLAGGWQQAEFRDFTTPDAVPQNFSNNDINFVPEFTLDASVTARTEKGIFGNVGVTAIGDYWLDEANTAKQSAYALLYARAGWQGKNFSVAVFGRNLTGAEYYANALDFGGGFIVGTPGDPRTYGIEVSAKF